MKRISLRRLTFSGIYILIFFNLTGQKYKVSDIPKELLTNAKAVIRNNETIFEIYDINKATGKTTLAITILNQNGIDKSIFYEFYNKFLSVKNISWDLYDKDGNRIRKGTSVELKDYSAISGYSIYEDNRIKFLDPNYRATPFTVEYKYEVDFNGLLNYPVMAVYDDYNISVEKKTLKIITPGNFRFRYTEKRMPDSCIKSDNGNGKKSYLWIVQKMPALREEPYSLPLREYTPVVYAAPEDFEISGYKGNLGNWDNFSRWFCNLNVGRTTLNIETKAHIKELTGQKTTEFEKINILYHYMQEKVRYVSIQVGIGGWQTIEAETVDRLSYGDCKALSNYMKALLDAAGIKSYYTLVRAGKDANEILSEFPSNQFNHAIICVPLQKDTIWLECTDQNLPAGFLGDFTDDRNVLLIHDDGGTVVRTKKYTINDNLQERKATVTVLEDGNAEADIRSLYKGIPCDEIYKILYMDDADKKKDIQKRIPVKSFNVVSFKLSENRDIIPSIIEDTKLDLPNFCSISGNRIFFCPNLMTRLGKLPVSTNDRKSPIHIKRPYTQTDTIIFQLPVSYRVEQVPENKIFSAKFGEYGITLTYDRNQLKYIRSFKMFSGDYPVTDYQDFVNFCEKISVIDDRKVILSKQL